MAQERSGVKTDTNSTLHSVNISSLTSKARCDAGLGRRSWRVSFNRRSAVFSALPLLVAHAEAPLDGVFEVVGEVVVSGGGGRFGEGASTVLFQGAYRGSD